ncbi:MAG: PAS domain S-box protein, partial [Dehalococcoidia bacterium]|nr:PAS domain S-box protein [Dehalococcoidia bacterium]
MVTNPSKRSALKSNKRLIEETQDGHNRFAALGQSGDWAALAGAESPSGELVASAAIDQMADSVILVDLAGQVLYVNKAFERLLGYGADELAGRCVFDLPTYHGLKDKEKAHAALKEVLSKGTAEQTDVSAVDRKGREIPLSFSASVLKDGHGKPTALVAVIRDITTRKVAEDALKAREEHFRALVENSLDGSAILDRDLTIRYENPAAKRILGYLPDELVGKATLDFLHPDDAKNVIRTRSILARNPGKAISMEVRFRHKDGTWRILEGVVNNLLDDPRVNGIVVNYRDITKRKQVEQALREREGHLLALIENSLDDISILNADGSIRYQSPSIKEVLGYKPEENLGHNSLEFVHPNDKQATVEAFARLVDTPNSMMHFEVRTRHKNGSWRTLEVAGRNLLHDPIIDGILASFRDITERKLTEQKNLEHAAALARAEELERSRQRIVTVQESVRRDIAQQLHGSVQNRLIILLHRLAELEQAASTPEFAADIGDLRQRLVELLEHQVRAISHRLYPSILRRGLSAALQSLGDQFDEAVAVTMNLEDAVVQRERQNPQLIVEQVRLAAYRIAEEALTNAVKHAKASEVTIALKLASDGWLNLAVRNDGRGFKVKESSGGLGIMMMHDYAEVMGGRCVIHSSPTRGTEVRVSLPL